jgi:hypothetical protein
MNGAALHQSRLRRLLVACGLVFVAAASLGLIAYQELELPKPQRRLPVVLAGRLFTRSPRIDPRGVPVHFRRPEPLQPGRRSYVATTVTDASGNFSFEEDFRGQAHLFLDRFRLRDSTYRPISDVSLPASEKLEIELIEGAAASGRVVKNGLPEAGMGIAVKFVEPAANDYFYAFQGHTDSDGRFRFEHLPEGVEFWISALRSGGGLDPQPSDALLDDQTFLPIRFRTGRDRTTIELGDFQLRTGARLSGRVILADGKTIPENCVVAAGRPGAGGWVYSRLDKTGRFQIKGLPHGTIAAHVRLTWTANPPGYPVPLDGYRVSARNACLDPTNGFDLVGRLDHDIDDLTILLEPAKGPAGPGAGQTVPAPDQSAIARFQKAKAGPITGAAFH